MKTLIAAASISLFTSLVSAEDVAKEATVEVDTTRIQFEILDIDQNEKISIEEAANSDALSAKFVALDVNNDGNLDGEEFSKFTPEEK